MPSSFFPLRWESTGDQWWFAAPIDLAAASGHYVLVRALLLLDPNLLLKLSSLRRLRRLESLWDDDPRLSAAAKHRSRIARRLLKDYSLLHAGYGGWLLYSAAAAGDLGFARELLDEMPMLVFGEGEYGVSDLLYAAARGGKLEVFRLVFGLAMGMQSRCLLGGIGSSEEESGSSSIFREEMVNRAVHAAARGGSLEMLKEIVWDWSDGDGDVSIFRDGQGATILHSASGRGQVEVVKYLVANYNIISSRDNQGNTALHVAAFRGHLAVIGTLLCASPSSSILTNYSGETFLHMAVAGFRTPGFRRLDKQMELMKQLMSGDMVDIAQIVNIRNQEGRTALHMAVIGNANTNLVELLMTVRSIDLNIQDLDGMTPLDLLSQSPRSASTEILIKQLIFAGGISNSKKQMESSARDSHLKIQGIGDSPGTSFGILDSEIFLYSGVGALDTTEDRISGGPSSSLSASKPELAHFVMIDENDVPLDKTKQNNVNNAARRLKVLLHWPHWKGEKTKTMKKVGDDDYLDSFKSLTKSCKVEEIPTPLRAQFAKGTSLQSNKRTLSVRNSMPSPSMKKEFAAGLMHGVIQTMPYLAPSEQSSPSNAQKGSCWNNDSSCASPISVINEELEESKHQRSGFVNNRLMNHYFCFGAQGLVVEDPFNGNLLL